MAKCYLQVNQQISISTAYFFARKFDERFFIGMEEILFFLQFLLITLFVCFSIPLFVKIYQNIFCSLYEITRQLRGKYTLAPSRFRCSEEFAKFNLSRLFL